MTQDPNQGKKVLPKLPFRRIPDDMAWRLDAEGEILALPPEWGIGLRFASVLPFLLATLLGIVSLIGWCFVILLGGARREPIWVLMADGTLEVGRSQLALAFGLGFAALGVTLLSMWASFHGLAGSSGRVFWRGTQIIALLLAAALAFAAVSRADFLASLEVSWTYWVGAYAVLCYALVMCQLRLRRLDKARNLEQ